MFRNYGSFYGEELAPRPTPKLEGHPLSAVSDCLFNIFAIFGGRSSTRNLTARRVMVTGTDSVMRSLMICTAQPILCG